MKGLQEIKFKSTPEMYEKEKSGRKNNMAQELDVDLRFDILSQFYLKQDFYLNITIVNSKTGEYFTRLVRDVSYLDDKVVIITWQHYN